MHRQWYLGFGAVLLVLLLVLVMLQDTLWFLVLLIPLLVLGSYDLIQKKHTILRNFPVLGHMRFIIEFIRPEIQQYLVANDTEELPFDRSTRSIVYQRSKAVRDTIPFGSESDIRAVGYTWVLHSIQPKHAFEVVPRVRIGGADCQKPYEASLLNISAMSFGALSEKAIMALNLGAKLGGFAHNTGEGGLSSYHLQGGDIIFQIGTAYFGCRDEQGRFCGDSFALEAGRPEVKMIELKLSQGAKPSHGGILPAAKLTEEIARARKVPMGKDVLSPPAHSSFNNPRGLLEFIHKLRRLSGGKPVGFKLCIGLPTEFMAICKAMLATGILPDFITVDGAEGGTGAAPLEFANRIGWPLEESLVFVHNTLVGLHLRDKIRIICSGKIATGYDMVEKIAIGADLCNTARAMMMAVGCIQSKQCNANTCPTGVATQSKRLQRGLVVENKKLRVANFHRNTMKSFMEIVGAMGFSNPNDLNPHVLMRRIGVDSVKSFDQLYDYLKPGQLLSEDCPELYKMFWNRASADSF